MQYLLVALAALSSGAAVILQTMAARSEPDTDGVDAGLLIRLARNPTYLAALALVTLGFLSAALALRDLPVYVVQAGRASSIAVTALLATRVLAVRLGRTDIIALVVMAVGLVLLAVSSPPTGAATPSTEIGWVLLGLTAGLIAASLVALRRNSSGIIFGLLSGAAFGLLAVAVRVVLSRELSEWLVEPAVVALIIGPVGMHLGAVALRRANPVTVAAIIVATETILGAVIGLLIGGALPHGTGIPVAVAGTGLILGSAIALSRFAALPAPTDPET